jgi:UDP-N-acetylmuramoyl-tripeptide--D-alanyl-D-alanine ligase
MFTLEQAANWVRARRLGADVGIQSVGTDTRQLRPGQLYVALEGERFDGHAFLAEARERGAVAAMVSHENPCELPQLLVEDTRAGLGRLASAWRRQLPGRLVAITGSNGKTTCKEMMAAVLGRVGRVRSTRGNLNNDIGMPLSLLEARTEDFLVLEMGANHPGEIAYLTNIAHPDLALITNVGRAHLEGFGTLEGVARAKGEIVQGLPRDGTFVVPADSRWIDLWRESAGERRVLTFGFTPDATVSADPAQVRMRWAGVEFETSARLQTPRGTLELKLALAGRHNLLNALAVVAAAYALDIGDDAIRAGLAQLRPVARRLQPRVCRGLRLIDDSYNANPDSVQAAIEVLARFPGPRWLVLGDLAELGAEAASLHRLLGEAARAAGIEYLMGVGPLSLNAVQAFGAHGRHFAGRPELIAALHDELTVDDLVLVKGSRSAAMDQVVDALCGEGEG